MRIKAICLGAALALSSGVASAGALDAADFLESFYTDSSMKVLKPMPEFKTAFMARPQSDREMMMRECQDAAQSKPYAEFCANVNALRGMQ
ncbi:hypothetical protein [Mesorhizobium sp. A556]